MIKGANLHGNGVRVDLGALGSDQKWQDNSTQNTPSEKSLPKLNSAGEIIVEATGLPSGSQTQSNVTHDAPRKVTQNVGSGQLPQLQLSKIKTSAISEVPRDSICNLDHLNFLGEWSNIGSTKVHYTWIYADQVDGGFRRMQADNMGHVEGKACIDDVARAAVVYLEDVETHATPDSIARAIGSLEFILQMQADNGEFFNFIYLDNTRNETGVTSYKSHGWWGVRALWAMAKGLRMLEDLGPEKVEEALSDRALAQQAVNLPGRLQRAISSLLPHIAKDVSTDAGEAAPIGLLKNDEPNGDHKGNCSMSSTAALALTELLRANPKDQEAQTLLASICDAMARYQDNDPHSPSFGAHLSQSNHWHGWGNRQSWALAEAAMVLPGHPHSRDWLASAAREANTFFARMLATHIPRQIDDGEVTDFDQIAYAVGPMVAALGALARATKQEKYAQLAGIAASWFYGNNPTRRPVYQQDTGVGLDGVRSATEISDNSGAESTIEALMALQQLELLPEDLQSIAKSLLTARRQEELPNGGQRFACTSGQLTLEPSPEKDGTYRVTRSP